MSANTTKTRVTPQPKTARDPIYAAIATHRLAWAEIHTYKPYLSNTDQIEQPRSCSIQLP